MIKLAVPLLHVLSIVDAEAFYCGQLGFKREFVHRQDDASPDPAYMSISRDDVWLHVSSFSGDGVAGSTANLITNDIDELHREFLAMGVAIPENHPVEQSWGSREMYIKDADRNVLRFIQWKR